MDHFSAVESYLQEFHQRHAGATSAAFGDWPARCGAIKYASSYALLATAVPQATAQPLTLVDLACGDGHLLKLLAERQQAGLQLTGIDMSQGELDLARAQLPAAVTLLKQRAQALSIESHSVDYVLSHMALMLMDDIEQVLAEIHRILRPGGTLATIVGGAFLPGDVLAAFLEVFRPIAKEDGLSSLRFGDPRTRDEAGWSALLGPRFVLQQFAHVEIAWQPHPHELWQALLQTYDVDRLSAPAQERCRTRLLEAVAPLQQSDGRLASGKGLLYIRAQAV